MTEAWSTPSMSDARVRAEHTGFCHALQAMGAPGFLFDPVAAYPELINIANAVHVVVRVRSINEWMANMPSPLAGIPLNLDANTTSPEALAAAAEDLFGLGRAGMLFRLLDYADDDVHSVTMARIYETLIPVVATKYRGYGSRLDPLDVANELFEQNLEVWARAYDPSRASLRTFLSLNSRPKGMRKASRINVGIAEDVLDTLSFDPDVGQVVAESIYSARIEANLPDVVRLHLDGYDYRHISNLLKISPVAARVQVHRYLKAERLRLGEIVKGHGRMESKEAQL